MTKLHDNRTGRIVFQIAAHIDGGPVFFDLQKPVVIGRSSICDVQVKDRAASKIHCRLVPDVNHLWLYDSGSRWGTRVNGRRVSSCELQSGDQITIGNSTFRFVWTGYFGLQQLDVDHDT